MLPSAAQRSPAPPSAAGGWADSIKDAPSWAGSMTEGKIQGCDPSNSNCSGRCRLTFLGSALPGRKRAVRTERANGANFRAQSQPRDHTPLRRPSLPPCPSQSVVDYLGVGENVFLPQGLLLLCFHQNHQLVQKLLRLDELQDLRGMDVHLFIRQLLTQCVPSPIFRASDHQQR